MTYALLVQYVGQPGPIKVGEGMNRLEVRTELISRMIEAEKDENVLWWEIQFEE